MKYAVFSDLHANASALRAVLADAKAHGVERFVCLGDIVGYGPLPAETTKLVREHCATVIAGNHDDAVSGRIDPSDFIDLAANAALRHREALPDEDLAWLRTLPHIAAIDGADLAHGDITEPKRFHYIENEADAAANFAASDAQLVFVGHTHTPNLFLTGRSGTVYRIPPQDFTLEDGKRYIVNPGSVGYPRETDGRCLSSYVLYDSTERTVSFRFLPFSVASVMQRGQSPRRIRKSLIAAIALAAAIAAGSLSWWLRPTRAERFDDPALVVDVRTLPLTDDIDFIQANLKLRRNSVSARLRVTYFDANDSVLTDETITVAVSSSKKIKRPEGATKAELTVLRIKTDDEVNVLSFAPTAKLR